MNENVAGEYRADAVKKSCVTQMKTFHISLRLTLTEWKALRAAAREAGVSVSEYVRRAVFQR